MKKNIIILVQGFAIIGLICLFYINNRDATNTKMVRFPEIKLGEKEHITQAMMEFHLASIALAALNFTFNEVYHIDPDKSLISIFGIAIGKF